MKKWKYLFIIMISFIFIIGVLSVNDKNINNEIILNAQTTNDREFKAVWVSPLVGDVSLNGESTFKTNMTEVLNVMDYYGLNALIFHVRTHNNALYPSEINPKATYVSNIDFTRFDPIGWLIKETHKRGIEFHAWMNPYRVDPAYQTGELPENNPQNNPENLIVSTTTILNPALEEVREHVFDTIIEFVELYPTVDAIHFDDYFYVQTDKEPTGANERRQQVDLLIEGIYDVLSEFNETNNTAIQFGISPTGIYKNGDGVVTYDSNGMPITTGSDTNGQEHFASYLYADTLKWAVNGWIDYLLPQTYWARNHNVASYTKLIDWWDKVFKNLDVNLYSGIGVYMANEENRFNWSNDPEEMKNQFELLDTLENVKGYSIYSYTHLLSGYDNSNENAGKQIRNAYSDPKRKAIKVLPEIKTMTPVIPDDVTNLIHFNGMLNWDEVNNAKFYYIYRSENELSYSSEEIIGVVGKEITSYITNDATNNFNYGIKALSKTNHLSGASIEAPAETYSITYELNGGNFLGDYANKNAMMDAFLEDFYTYLGLTSNKVEFKHGAGKTEGFDGTWHSAHKAKLYGGPRPTAVNEDYFVSSAAYMDKWLPLFDTIHEAVVAINSTQFLFGGGTWTGLIRFREYFINDPLRPQHDWLPEEYFPAKTYQNSSNDIILVNPIRENYIFEGWYLDAEFTGKPITVIEAEETGNITLYAKWKKAPVVIYDLGEYGYISEETKHSLLFDFVTDYKEFYGRTGFTAQQLYDNFAGLSYINDDIKDIFQPEYKNGKWAWLYEYLVHRAEETEYSELADLSAYTLLTIRTNIHGFIIEGQYTLSSSTSMDFSTEEAINGFWRHTPYNEVTKLPNEELLSGTTVTSWHGDYLFAGWYDNPEFTGEPVTEIPEELVGNYKLYAKWNNLNTTNLVQMLPGASIRTTGTQGLRFTAIIDESVKNNEHGFYLVYGSITTSKLINLITDNETTYQGKDIIKIEVPGLINSNNEFSVVLIGIPLKGYLDEITVVAYVKEGTNIKLSSTSVRRSIAEVTLKAYLNGEDVKNIITEIEDNLYTKTNEKGTLYELNRESLKEIFFTDWNNMFNTNFTNPTASEFFSSAKQGSNDEEGNNTNISNTNIYKFFNNSNYKDKWTWFLDYIEEVDYTIHTAGQIKAIKGNGTYINTNVSANQDKLYNTIHLSYSIYNFFNEVNENSGYTQIDFSDLEKYNNLGNYNNIIIKKNINLADYVIVID